MTKLFAICLALLVCERPAVACDAVATDQSTCVYPVAQGNRKGVWFDLPTADLLRREHDQIPALTQALATRKAAEEQWRLAADARKAEAAEERQRADAATAALSAWYRSPWLWLSAGIVLGSVIVLEVK